ncbi:MAG: hypothetical protein J6P46_03195 [Bacteroidales bacterium]|nr:hypothetical protein [Bacteroidales bacterium]
MRKTLLICMLALAPLALAAQGWSRADSTAQALADAGFANVRAVQTDAFTVFTIENDAYKIPAEGFARAVQIIEGAGLDASRPVKIIGTSYKVPELTVTYDPELGLWRSTKRLDASWDAVKGQPMLNNSFGKTDINVYPQVSLKNLIITQVYQSLWSICPAIEVPLWPGAKFSYQVKIPVVNDGYGEMEAYPHPGFITLSQHFRDPWHLNILGKATVGVFNSTHVGAALELAYWFPNERFWVDTKLGVLDLIRFGPSIRRIDGKREKGPLPEWLVGFWMHPNATPDWHLAWNVALNYYCPSLQTQFLLRAERFVRRDYGIKFEMIRHFRHCSVGFYAMKGVTAAQHTNGGFRFQIALPPYRHARRGYLPRISTSGQMGMAYNANNEQYYYQEFRSEASDNIMSKNYYNPYYINAALGNKYVFPLGLID